MYLITVDVGNHTEQHEVKDVRILNAILTLLNDSEVSDIVLDIIDQTKNTLLPLMVNYSEEIDV